MELVFNKEFIEEPLCDLLFQEINPVPEFLYSNYKYKIWSRLKDRINAFRSGFVSTIEENWLNFVAEERKNLQFYENKQAYRSKQLHLDVLSAAFNVMMILPLRAEVKHDTELVYNKIQNAKKLFALNSKPYPTWDYNESDMERRVDKLRELIVQHSEDDHVLCVLTIHRLSFTLFNAFINSKLYDSKDRMLLKLFLEEVTPMFRKLMLLND